MKKDVTNHLDVEPKASAGEAHIPLWLTAVLGLLLYWGCYYVDEHGGKFDPLVHGPYKSTNELATLIPGGADPALALGRSKYQQICAPCHQESGLGVPNQFPPLAGSEWVNTPGASRLTRLVQTGVAGPIKVKGTDWNLVMPPMGATLSDEELAAVLTYIRSTWGNKAPKVTPAQVKTVRAALAGRTDPHTSDELLKVPDTE